MVGNVPNFSKLDILRCFLRLIKNISRKELAKELELGEGTIRTILNLLKSRRLLDSNKKGHFLSAKGTELLGDLSQNIIGPLTITAKDLYSEFKKIGIVLRGSADIKETYKLRDISVKNGADGAVILKFDNKLRAPDADYEIDLKPIEKIFDFRNGDVLIIGFSGSKRKAENGALAIAVELNSSLKKFINEFWEAVPKEAL